MIPGWLLLGLLGAAHGEPEAPAAIYMVMVDRFANGDERNDADADPGVPTAFHGGDLQGIIDHLDSIQAMGFTQLWMSPIAQMRTEPISGHGAFHGYWVEDGARLEPRFGSPDVLEDLRLALKARRMVPVLDLVTNHVAPDAPLTRSHPEWFHGLGDVVDWADPTQRIQHDVHGLPDLAQERPEVTSHLISQARAWGAGADPIRLDAVRHLPPSFVRAYREALSGPEEPAIVYGEIFEGNTVRLARAASEYGLDHTFDFPLHYALVDVFCRGADARVIAAVLSGDSAYAPGSVHLSFLDNHDLPRIRTACGGDEQQVAAAMELMLALRGIPVITYGTESGLVGQTETEARSDMDFERVAPVGRVIQEGLARRRSQPAIARAPTVTASASQDSMVLLRPGGESPLRMRWSRAGGVSWSEGADHRLPESMAVLPLRLPDVVLEPGQTLWLSGSSEALGGWDPDHATGPLVPGAVLKLKQPWGTVIATKLLIKAADGAVSWASGDNSYQVTGLEDGQPQTEPLVWPAQ